MNHAYETDNGPGGMSWQVTDGHGKHVADLARDSDLLPFAPITLHTYKDWVADHVLMEDSNRAALVIEAAPTPWAEANDKLATLGLPLYDGSGCRTIELGTDVHGLVDWDNGTYRVGLYYSGTEDDGGTCAEFKDFGSLEAFIARLRHVHAPTTYPPRPEMDPNFLPALRAFVEAGGELVDVWGDADQVAPLPPRLAPPLSLDEWLLELQLHYEAALGEIGVVRNT